LGFVDVKHHHSKSSGYYQHDGKETYDYADSANTSLIVPGNFRPKVNTKHEFKVSRQVIEQVTSAKPKGQEFYNCSDGAKIQGALAIRPDELLIVVTEQQNKQVTEKLKTHIFSTKELGNYIEKFEKQFSHDVLIEELSAFETLLENEVTSKYDVEKIINKQKEMLFTSYKNGNSMLFYYLYGTVNYANAVLTKLLFTQHKSDIFSKAGMKALGQWKGTLTKINVLLAPQDIDNFDISFFKRWEREYISLKLKAVGHSLLIISDDADFNKSTEWTHLQHYPFLENVQIISSSQAINYRQSPEYVIYYQHCKVIDIYGKYSTILISDKVDMSLNGVTHLPLVFKNENIIYDTFYTANLAIRASLSSHNCDIILGKHNTCDESIFNEDAIQLTGQKYVAYDFPLYVCIYTKNHLDNIVTLSKSGSRGQKLLDVVRKKNLLHNLVPPTEILRLKQRALSILKLEDPV
jgi:hypothetical protein